MLLPTLDADGGVQPHARAEQAVVADVDVAAVFLVLPGGQRHASVAGGDDVRAFADADVRAMHFQVPGFHDLVVTAELVELRGDEMIDVGPFDGPMQALDRVGAEVLSHALSLPVGGRAVTVGQQRR